MGYFDDPQHVEEYVRMSEGYDGRELAARLRQYVAPGASVLELGMGPGKDLALLSETFQVVGSDSSLAFLERYRRAHPHADLLPLDALTIATERTFDAIYSNKVLMHLPRANLALSFRRQLQVLNPGGIALHSFWCGEGEEEHQGLLFVYYDMDALRDLVPDGFTVLEMALYQEEEPGDSIVVVLRRR